MRQNVNKTAGVFVRALVVFASLVSLCVSDGIGPRLVPYPSQATPERAAPAARARLLSTVRSEARAASEHQPKAITPVWNNASLACAAISPPAVSLSAPPDLYDSAGYFARTPSSTRGRAPPPNS